MVRGSTPAFACAVAMTVACPSTPGAAKLIFAAPSLLTATPRSTAWISSPSACASDSRLSTTAPTPSLKRVPVALASKGRQCPSWESMPPSWYRWPDFCGTVTAAPPASATSHWCVCKAQNACATATSDVEHAVFSDKAGPRRSSLCATRVAT
ncbi:hypothetical protein COSO111634_22080 [Corallococcus soli]